MPGDMTEVEFFAQLADVVKDAAEHGIDASGVLAMLGACMQAQGILSREGVELHADQVTPVMEWAVGVIDEATMVQRCREVVS